MGLIIVLELDLTEYIWTTRNFLYHTWQLAAVEVEDFVLGGRV